MIKVFFVYPDGSKHEFEANEGETVLQIARRYEIPLEGACEGSLACSTCHVIVDETCYAGKLMQKSIEEEDMLDLAYGLTATSRLGCQIKLDKSMDGVVFYLPGDSRNFSPNNTCCGGGCK